MSLVITQKTMFLHVTAEGNRQLLTCDMTEHYICGVCLGPVDCEITYEDIEADPREVMISKLEEQIEKEKGDSYVRINALLDRVNQLKCLEYKAGAA